MSCICAYTDPGSVYPVIDPRRCAGDRPLRFGYGFAWDYLRIDVDEAPSLTNCEMLVGLEAAPNISWQKDILAWNYCLGGPVSSVTTKDSNRGPNYMLVRKADCYSGANTLLLRKLMSWNQMTGLYTLNSREMWDFWGGMKVTFRWVGDQSGSGVWGSATAAPHYPGVRFPDGTLIRGRRRPGATFLVVGGAKFRVDRGNSLGLMLKNALVLEQASMDSLTSLPADFTVVRDPADPHPYVCFGGARFPFQLGDPLFTSTFDTEVELNLGFLNVHVLASPKLIPPGTASTIPRVPCERTLLKEAGDPAQKVYAVENGRLRWVTTEAAFFARCLATRNVRTVPAGSLATLPKGPDIV